MFGRSTRVPWLFIILLTALALRCGAAVAVQQRVDATPGKLCLISGDAEGYWELAGKIIRGDDYALFNPPRYTLRMPGFPVLLASGMALFGERPLALRLLLAAMGTAACGLVYCLGAATFDRQIGLWACALAAVSPAFVGFSVLFLSETFFALAMVASLLALAWFVAGTVSRAVEGGRDAELPAERHDCAARPPLPPLAKGGSDVDGGSDEARVARPHRWRGLVAGVAIGLATLVRPTWLLVGPGFVLVYWLQQRCRRRAAIEGAWLLLGLALTVAPWTIRNAFVTGHFVVTALWSGASLYDGLNENADGSSNMQFIDDDGIYAVMPEYEADRHYRKKAFEFMRRNPWRTVELAALKLARFWSLMPHAHEVSQPLLRWGFAIWTVPFLLLALAGFWQTRHDFWRWFLLSAPVLYFSFVHLFFVGSLRYRLPAEYPLCVLAAVGSRFLLSRFGCVNSAQHAIG